MNVLLVGAGASFSVKDVENGYFHALQQAGIETHFYGLDRRMDLAARWLSMLWRERGERPKENPTWGDVVYRASVEALEMALRFQVDWVVLISGMFFHPDALVMMRRAGLRTAVLFTESPYDDVAQIPMAELVDQCWTTERSSVRRLPNCRYIRHAYDPDVHRPIGEPPVDTPAHDVVFVGTGFPERIALLEAIDWTGLNIDLGLYGMWSMLPPDHPLQAFVRGTEIPNAEATALYRNAKIGLNLYRAADGVVAVSLNPRAYELAACGVFQISDRRAEVAETFGAAVPTFQDAAGLEGLVREYLSNPEQRQALALSAHRKVNPHTFAARAAQLLADLEAVEPIAKGA